MFAGINWTELFSSDVPALEIIIRGTLTYLGLFLLLRFVLKRQSGAMGIPDLLVLVLIADAAQNAMSGDYRSISDGLLLVATIIISAYSIDWLGYRIAFLEQLVYPSPLPLVRDGRLLLDNMRKELITRHELMSQLRTQGISDLKEVKQAYLEGDGTLSVIKTVPDEQKPQTKKEIQRSG